jgi:hypothetical protein
MRRLRPSEVLRRQGVYYHEWDSAFGLRYGRKIGIRNGRLHIVDQRWDDLPGVGRHRWRRRRFLSLVDAPSQAANYEYERLRFYQEFSRASFRDGWMTRRRHVRRLCALCRRRRSVAAAERWRV